MLFKFSVFEESKIFTKVREYMELTDEVMCNVGGNILGILIGELYLTNVIQI